MTMNGINHSTGIVLQLMFTFWKWFRPIFRFHFITIKDVSCTWKSEHIFFFVFDFDARFNVCDIFAFEVLWHPCTRLYSNWKTGLCPNRSYRQVLWEHLKYNIRHNDNFFHTQNENKVDIRFFLYRFSIITTGWENCTIAWQILCWLEGITPLFPKVLTRVLTHLRRGWAVISYRRNYLTLSDAVLYLLLYFPLCCLG